MHRLRNLGGAFDENKGPWERRLLLGLIGAAVFAVVVIVGAYYFDHATESDAFCGQICHANFAEFAAHKVSDHANVECSECHIGPGLWPKVDAKIFGTVELVKHLTNTYSRPVELPVERLKPASVICEQCHSPEVLHEDRIRRVSYFAADEANSEDQAYLELRIGADETQGKQGVHWHAENQVFYAALDPENQEIPWVGVMKNGELVEYLSADSSLTAQELAGLTRQEMDCIDCHNRAGHDFVKPEQSVDEALASGVLDRSLPFIKREAMKLLSASYSSRSEAFRAIAGLKDFYRTQYPEVFAAREVSVEAAVAELQIIYSYSTFPTMNLTWESYPDNSGHTDFPGCFRCHDGSHVNVQQEAIPLYCDTCHSLPVTAASQPEVIAALSDIPSIPHAVEETSDCLACHGASGVRPAPATHEEFTVEACLLCHVPK